MTTKGKVRLSKAYGLLHPMHTVLVTCADKIGRPNIITLAWAMPTSVSPPLVAVSVRPSRYSHKLITETKEFVVNVPNMDIVKETLFCGRRSGKLHCKFKETGLTAQSAKVVRAPIVKECVAHLECKLKKTVSTGDHDILIGEIVAAYAIRNRLKAKHVFHLGGNKFATLTDDVTEPSL